MRRALCAVVVAAAAALAPAAAWEDAALAQQKTLAGWNSWLGSIANASTADVVAKAKTCKTNSEAFAARRKEFGCDAAAPTKFDCATLSKNMKKTAEEAKKVKACCLFEDGGKVSWLPASHKEYDETCEEYLREKDDIKCCQACTSDTNPAYPFKCTEEKYAEVAVCATDNNTPAKAPLPEGYNCATAPTFGTEGKYEKDDVNYDAPDCTQLDKDYAAGTAGAKVHALAAAESEPLGPYAKMRNAAAFVWRAVLADATFGFGNTLKCGVFLEPYVNGAFSAFEMKGETRAEVTKDTQSDMDLRIYKPTVLKGQQNNFTLGSIMVVGGSNAGALMFGSLTKSVQLQGINNTGSVMADGTKSVFMADMVNSGNVTAMNGASATLVAVTNAGHVSAKGGTWKLKDVTNKAGGTVALDGGEVHATGVMNSGTVTVSAGSSVNITLKNVTNKAGGTVALDGGKVHATGLVNSGTVTVSAGSVSVTLADNAGGSITIAEGVTGTITLLKGGGKGTHKIGSTVKATGFDDPPPPSQGGGTKDTPAAPAADKVAAAKAKATAAKAAALKKRDTMLAGIKDAKAKKKAELLAKASESGKKVKKMAAKVTAASADDACKTITDTFDKDAGVVCEAKKSASRRSLLADSYDTTTFAPPDVDTAKATKALKDAGVTATVAESDPIEELKKVEGVNTAALAEFETASKAVVAADAEQKAAEDASPPLVGASVSRAVLSAFVLAVAALLA